MRRSDVERFVHVEPFRPFQIWLTDGTTFMVRHPEQIVVGHSTAAIERRPQPGTEAEEPFTVALIHIIKMQHVKTPSVTVNGSAQPPDQF